MKNIIFFLFCISFFSSTAQNIDYNLSGGFIAEGYDVVAYFKNSPQKGSSKYVYEYMEAKYKFANPDNLNTFKSNPDKYIPQYGGYCAYAMGTSGDKVSIDPKTYEIRGDRLFLFYNAFFTNTFEKWKEEGAAQLKTQADKNWEKVKFSK